MLKVQPNPKYQESSSSSRTTQALEPDAGVTSVGDVIPPVPTPPGWPQH